MKAFVLKTIRTSNPYVAKQVLYRVEPPIKTRHGDSEYVIASSSNAPFSGPETYLFPSDKEGNIKDFIELEGSFRGELDCDKAVKNAGYEVIR